MASWVPDGPERKGSMFLRSNQMNYGTAVLNSNWHQAIEQEPRDYDMRKAPVYDLTKSTYTRIGTATDGCTPESTYQFYSKQALRNDPIGNDVTRVTSGWRQTQLDMEKQMGRSKTDGVVLPNNVEPSDLHYNTTHKTDYKYKGFDDQSPANNQTICVIEDPSDNSAGLKKCLSQFTDTANHRRLGRNTWQDESGLYANSHLIAELPYHRKTYTLMPGGVKPESRVECNSTAAQGMNPLANFREKTEIPENLKLCTM